jgi:hypothetical protein
VVLRLPHRVAPDFRLVQDESVFKVLLHELQASGSGGLKTISRVLLAFEEASCPDALILC